MKVTFLGLGVMGFPMAGHLAAAGHDVTVYNRTQSKAKQWCKEHTGRWAATVAEAVEDAQVVFSCVGNDDDVRSVTTGPEGAFSAMTKGAIFVDHTTTSAELALELNAAAKPLGIRFMDAPVSGGQAGAVSGMLTVMCGSDPCLFSTLEPVFEAYAKSSVMMGDVGQGQRAKMVNQICISGVLAGLSEGLLLAQKSGLDIEALMHCLKNGAAGSWQMENRGLSMNYDKFDFGFAVEWMIKDLGICATEARKHGLGLALTEKTLHDYQALAAQGHGRDDTSVLIKAIAEQSKVPKK
ncbi:2-hydroxy-3-oxopropionate reductase [Vibrio sp. qd031]|uniref:NAD(P)-dependent oxidoreductase n=1 Tax=Vibrio sp. qd031 TaxID=1603038 RepID=UPI000A117379|nr:NAD(P)-dependent oxidoreductase [Vibrio sp. qd031]ORT48577.1 2-hydroxy-3-oxopropionate reductase [Vibrio sp. qd031]